MLPQKQVADGLFIFQQKPKIIFCVTKKTGTKIKPISNSNSSYLSSNDYVSWGICTNTNKNNYCDGYDHSPIKGPSAPYLVRKSSEDANNLEVNSNIFIISSPQILSGNYKTKLVYTLINTSAPELGYSPGNGGDGSKYHRASGN